MLCVYEQPFFKTNLDLLWILPLLLLPCWIILWTLCALPTNNSPPSNIVCSAARNSANLYACERARTPHFHLPSYKFVHEDPRPLFVDCGSANGTRVCGLRCLRCGLPRKDPSWKEIDAAFDALSADDRKSLDRTQQLQSRVGKFTSESPAD